MAKPFSVKPTPAGVPSKDPRKADPKPCPPEHQATGEPFGGAPCDESSTHSNPIKWPPAEQTPGDHPPAGYKPFKVK